MVKSKRAGVARRRNRPNQSSSTTPGASNAPNKTWRVSHGYLVALAKSMVDLQQTLENHPQMNKAAPQSSPQLLFYTTDFLRRTMREYLLKLDPDKINAGSKNALEAYQDVLSRNTLLASIIDDKTGKSKFFGKPSEQDFTFGEEVLAKTKVMMEMSFDKSVETDEAEEAAEGDEGEHEVEVSSAATEDATPVNETSVLEETKIGDPGLR